MTTFTIDLLDASNNPIGSGPLTNVLSVSAQEKLDEAGQVSFTVPATDDRVATDIDQADRFRVRLSSGAYIYGIIEKDTLDAASEQPTRTIVGANMLQELQQYSMGWWCFYASSNLNTVILPELVAGSLAEFEAAAIRLASHPQELGELRLRLNRSRGQAPLFDTARFTRNIERAYTAMWNLSRQGEKPRPIEIDET